MAERILPADFASQIVDLERRLRTLEATSRVPQVSSLTAGPVFGQVIDYEATTSTAYTDLATPGPEVTVTVGQTGRVVVTAGAFTTSPVDNQTVDVGVSVDGGAALQWAIVENLTGGAFSASVAHSELVEDLAPGEHTFRLKYRQSLPGANEGRFGLRFLQVQPY